MLRSAALLVGMVCAVPALAQVTQLNSPNPAPKGTDPNKKICEKTYKTGSRLGAVTVCMTAIEWKNQRQGQREDIERAQQRSGIKVEGN